MIDTPAQHPEFRVPQERLRPGDDQAWERLEHDGWCFAGEAARILEITELNYRQLRKIYCMARKYTSDPAHRAADVPKGKWSRYTARDLASAAEVVRLCVTPADESASRRLRFNTAQLEHACDRLVADGVANPLLELHFDWIGRRLVATANGVLFEARTGQMLMADVATRVRRQQGGSRLDPRLARVLKNEQATLRQDRNRNLKFSGRPHRSNVGGTSANEPGPSTE